MFTTGHLTSQTYLCKNLGVEEWDRHLFEDGLLAGDYNTLKGHPNGGRS